MMCLAAFPVFAESGDAPNRVEEYREAFRSHHTNRMLGASYTAWDVSWLPPDLHGTANGVSLVVDPKEEGLTVLYLINRTDAVVWVPWRVSRERKTDGGWEHLAERHTTCGNQDPPLCLRPGEAFRFQSAVGRGDEVDAEVRFTVSVSSAAEGPITAASGPVKGRVSRLEIREGRSECDVALHWVETIDRRDRQGALEYLAALHLLRKSAPGWELRRELGESLEPGSPLGWPEALEPEIRHLILLDWQDRFDWKVLVKDCIEVIVHPSGKISPPEAEAERRAAWHLLSEVNLYAFDPHNAGECSGGIEQNFWGLDAQTALLLMEKTREAIAEKSPLSKKARLILARFPGGALAVQDLMDLLHSEDSWISSIARLKLASTGQIALLRSSDTRAHNAWEILRACYAANTQPDEEECRVIAAALRDDGRAWAFEGLLSFPVYGPAKSGRPKLPEILRVAVIDGMKSYLATGPGKRIMATDDRSWLKQPEYFCDLLEMLDEGPLDGPYRSLLEDCLGSYLASSVNKPDRQVKLYPVRRRASELLAAHQIAPPSDLVFEEPLTVREAFEAPLRQ